MEHNPDPSSLTEVLSAFARDLEQQLEQQGWDQPSSLWGMRLTSEIPSEVLASIETDDAQAMGMLSLQGLSTFYENPATVLIGHHAPEEALGVLLATEGWTFPDDVIDELKSQENPFVLGPPSEHPRRVELRQVVGMMKDGSTVFVRRVRDQEPEIEENPNLSGRMIDALRCYLRAPSTQTLPPPQRWYQLLVVNALTEMVIDTAASLEGGDEQQRQLIGELVVRVLEAFHHGGLAEAVEGTPLAVLKEGPAESMTWVDIKQISLDNAREAGNEDLVRFLEWADETTYFNTLDVPQDAQSHLRTLGAVLSDEHLDRARAALLAAGLI